MNKKFLFGALAVIGGLFTTSCSNDDFNQGSTDDEVQVSFTIDLEDGLATRAISDGSGADQLVFTLFDGEGNRITSYPKYTYLGVTFPYTLTLSLAKGQTYKVAFWAQNKACTAYTVDDNMKVTVNYEANNNDETRDAFFKTTDAFTVTGSQSMDVVLKRPFAQINLGTLAADWNIAVNSGVQIAKSSAVIKNAASTLDIVTGKTGTPVEVNYGLSAIPTETLQVDADGDGTKEDYKWLSMNYILVNDGSETGADQTTLDGLKFTLQPTSGSDITIKKGLVGVPVQRNYRTNILGQILTGNVTFNISIDPIYDGDYIYPNGTLQQLTMAAGEGGTVTLSADVTLTDVLTVAAGKSMVVNLNGHKITQSKADAAAFVVEGNLEINGTGTIETTGGPAVEVKTGGNATLNDGVYTVGASTSGAKTRAVTDSPCIYANGGVAEIYGGTYSTVSGGKVLKTNSDITSSSIKAYGGVFKDFDVTSFLATGYKSVVVDGTSNDYVVLSNDITIPTGAKIIVTDDGFASAAATENATVVLAGKSFAMPATVGAGTTLMGTGSTVVTVDKANITLSADNVTVKDLTLKASSTHNSNITPNSSGAINTPNPVIKVTGKNATFNNLTITGGLSASANGGSYRANGVQIASGASATFKDCTFNGSTFRGIYSNSTEEIVVDNCSFSSAVVYAFNGNGNLKASNCTFRGWLSGWNQGGTFTNCTFTYGTSYWPAAICYGDSEFKNCTFNNSGEEWSGSFTAGKAYLYHVSCGTATAVITFTGCKYSDGTDITTELFKLYVGDGQKGPAKVIIDGTVYDNVTTQFGTL